MKVKCIVEENILTNNYIISECGKCILIDPSDVENIDKVLLEMNVEVDLVIITHEHYDHIKGIDKISNKYKVKVLSSQVCIENTQKTNRNLSKYFYSYLCIRNWKSNDSKYNINENNVIDFKCHKSDFYFNDTYEFLWQGHNVKLFETPGHSEGSISIVIDNNYLFSGDSLLKIDNVVTRFPGGSTKSYKSITLPKYKLLNKDMIVYPGHGEHFILGERIDSLNE